MRRRDFILRNGLALTLAPFAAHGGRPDGRGQKEKAEAPATSLAWWENEPFLVYEVNMFTSPGFSVDNNWQQTTDPAVEVGDVAASGALQTHLTSIIPGHSTNRFCYFRSPRFKENRRDYLAAYLEKSKQAGYRSILYFNVHAVKPEFGGDRPGWRQIRFNGTPIDGIYGVETSFCVNSPWRDWVRDVCVDLCAYPIDGIFFDGPCLFAQCCYCEHCRKLYRERFGTGMPPKEAGHPELKRLAGFQADSLRAFMAHADAAIKKRRPDVLLCSNAGPREEPSYLNGRNNRILIKSQDVLGAEGGFVYDELSRQPAWRVGSNAKYYQEQAGGKPTIVFISPAHGPWKSAYLSESEIRLAIAQAVVHGSGVWFAAFHWFPGQPAFNGVKDNYRFFSAHRDVYFKGRSKARLAVVWPADSLNFYKKPKVLHSDFVQGGQEGNGVGSINDEFNGFYDSLIRNHFPCDIIDEEGLRAGNLGRYDLIILPNAACTDGDLGEALRRYVREGGNLLASFETSLCDQSGRRLQNFSLGDVFGVRMLRSPLRPYPHFYFFRRDSHPGLFEGISAELLAAPLLSCEVAPEGAKPVSPFSIKFKGWDGSEILPAEFPAATVNEFGRGRAMYLAGAFGEHYWKYKQPDIRMFLRNICRSLCGRDVEIEGAPESVELVHRSARDGRDVVSLINYGGGLSRPFESITPLENITVRVRTSETDARALKSGARLETRREGEWLVIRLPKLGIFETLVIG